MTGDEPLTDYTPEQMEEYVKGVLKTHAPGGRDTPARPATAYIPLRSRRTLRAMQNAIHKYGKYRPDGTLDWM